MSHSSSREGSPKILRRTSSPKAFPPVQSLTKATPRHNSRDFHKEAISSGRRPSSLSSLITPLPTPLPTNHLLSLPSAELQPSSDSDARALSESSDEAEGGIAEGGSFTELSIAAVMLRDENRRCADCNCLDPTWASVNVGCFICTHCAGVHRSLGVHITFILSAKLDDWSQEQVQSVANRGNAMVNGELEFYVPANVEKPASNEGREKRQRYIESKYVQKAFTAAHAPLDPHGRPMRMPPIVRTFRDLKPADAPMSPGQQGMVLYDSMLSITLKHGIRLDRIGDQGKVYCQVGIGLQNVRSRTKPNDVPWDETLMVCCCINQPLTIGVFAKRRGYGRDLHVGSAVLNLEGTPPDETVDVAVPLRGRRSLAPQSVVELVQPLSPSHLEALASPLRTRSHLTSLTDLMSPKSPGGGASGSLTGSVSANRRGSITMQLKKGFDFTKKRHDRGYVVLALKRTPFSV